MGCPFGCQKAHRKQESNRRSAAYYNTPKGKARKRILNRNRSLKHIPKKCKTKNIGQSNLPIAIVTYLAMILSVLEGRKVRKSEVIAMLIKKVRQRSVTWTRKIEYIVKRL